MANRSEYLSITPETWRLIQGQESREVEFKQKPDAIKAETFVAFANAAGGTILIGVAETAHQNGKQCGSIVGCDISDQTKQRLINMAASCSPTIEIILRIENLASHQPIIRLDISEGSDKPYATAGGVYKVRSDGQNIAIDPSLMKAIVFEQESEQFVERFRAAADAVTINLNEMYLNLSKQIKRVEHAAKEAADASFRAEIAAHEAEAAAQESMRNISPDSIDDYFTKVENKI